MSTESSEKILLSNIILFFKDFIYLFLQRGEGREKERETHISVCLPLVHPLLATWPATQACALAGNQIGHLLVQKPELNSLSHTSQGWFISILDHFNFESKPICACHWRNHICSSCRKICSPCVTKRQVLIYDHQFKKEEIPVFLFHILTQRF